MCVARCQQNIRSVVHKVNTLLYFFLFFYPGYFQVTHRKSMGLPEISRATGWWYRLILAHILQSYFTGNRVIASLSVKYSWRMWVNNMFMTPLWTQTKQNIRNRLYILYITLYSQWVSIVTVSAGCLLAPADLLFNSRITSHISHNTITLYFMTPSWNGNTFRVTGPL